MSIVDKFKSRAHTSKPLAAALGRHSARRGTAGTGHTQRPSGGLGRALARAGSVLRSAFRR